MGATAAAAVVLRKQRELVEHFRQAGAVSPSTARSSSELGVHERFAWIRLVSRGVIREAEPATYYLDESAWESLRQRRMRLAVALTITLIAIAVVLVILRGAL